MYNASYFHILCRILYFLLCVNIPTYTHILYACVCVRKVFVIAMTYICCHFEVMMRYMGLLELMQNVFLLKNLVRKKAHC